MIQAPIKMINLRNIQPFRWRHDIEHGDTLGIASFKVFCFIENIDDRQNGVCLFFLAANA
jgi:hypothetical protein